MDLSRNDPEDLINGFHLGPLGGLMRPHDGPPGLTDTGVGA